MLNELRGRIRVVFFKGLQITESAVFVNESILVIISSVFLCFLGSGADQTGTGDILYIDLNFLSRILRLLVLLRM